MIILTKKQLAFILFLFIAPTITLAQKATVNDKYSGVLSEMQRLYEAGKIVSVQQLFYDKCCEVVQRNAINEYKETKEFKSVSNEIKARIYELQALSVISSNNPDESSKYLRKLFAIEHNKSFSDSWLAIRAEREKYLIIPRLSIGVMAGANLTSGIAQNNRSFLHQTGNESSGGQKQYTRQIGNFLGLKAEYRLNKNILMNVGLRTNKMNFAYTVNYNWHDDKNNSIGLKNIHSNNLRYIEIPLHIKYELKGKLRPFLQAGLFYGYLQMAERSMEYTVTENIQGFYQANTYTTTIKTADQLLKYHTGYSLAAGFEFNIGSNLFICSANLQNGFNNIVSNQNIYTNKELMYHFYDIFDNIKISNLCIGITYLYAINYGAYYK